MEDGQSRNTPSCHPMERRARIAEVDDRNKTLSCRNEENQLLAVSHTKHTERIPLKSLNVGKSELKSAAERKLRTVKRTWGTFKSKMIPARGLKKPKKLWFLSTKLKTPQTPSTERRLINSPLTPSLYSHTTTPAKTWYQYRNLTSITPITPFTQLTQSQRRRSPRLANTRKVISNRTLQDTPNRIQVSTSTSPLSSNGDDPIVAEIVSKFDFLSEGMNALETMSQNLSQSIEKQNSEVTLPGPKSMDKKAETSSVSSRHSLRLRPRGQKNPSVTK